MRENNLKKLRKECALTQQQVSEALGLERSTYTYYETGKTDPSIATLQKIMVLFNCSFSDIYPFGDNVSEPKKNENNNDFSLHTINDSFAAFGKVSDNYSSYNGNSGDNSSMLYADEREMIENYRLLKNEDKKRIFEEILDITRGISE